MSTSNLKISIAALSLCVSAVAIYIHLPYVIAAVSGSGAIEAAPLAIFAVSAIVALVSVICLIRLAVSRAGDKKKAASDGEQPTNKSTEVGSNGKLDDTNASKNSSPSSLPPPPPPLSSAARKNSANTTDEEPPVNAASKSSPPKVPMQCPSQSNLEESSLYKKAQVKNNADNMLDPRKLDDEKIKAEELNLKDAASSPPPVMFETQPSSSVSVRSE
ncbi:MAG: hypothetical protein ACR5K5_06705 [Wolbachia sp.]